MTANCPPSTGPLAYLASNWHIQVNWDGSVLSPIKSLINVAKG